MAYTATLKVFDKRSGEYHVVIAYTNTDTEETFLRKYRLNRVTKKNLRSLARDEVNRIDQLDNNDVDIPVGTTIDITPDPVVPPKPPTQAELDRRAWFDDYNQVQQMQRVFAAVPELQTPARTTALQNLQSSLKTGWKNAYLESV